MQLNYDIWSNSCRSLNIKASYGSIYGWLDGWRKSLEQLLKRFCLGNGNSINVHNTSFECWMYDWLKEEKRRSHLKSFALYLALLCFICAIHSLTQWGFFLYLNLKYRYQIIDFTLQILTRSKQWWDTER